MKGDDDLSLCVIEPGERARVQNIVDEAKQPDYWFAASKDGSRESHYRGAHVLYNVRFSIDNWVVDPGRLVHSFPGPALGCTMMVQVKIPENQELIHTAIAAFQRRVEKELPGMYAWLSEDSYHVTLRAIMG